MLLNADFRERVSNTPDKAEWVPSPMPGVTRRMLDRIGEEKARATSIVRYEPGSYFSEHTHDGGEEYLVLEGVFSDESGDYPVGSYVRNPIGSKHTPFAKDGATIFVKLHQFDKADTEQKVIDTNDAASFEPGPVDGALVLPLHSFEGEKVAVMKWESGTRFAAQRLTGGEEILVLDGVFETSDGGRYPAGSWLRGADSVIHADFTREESAVIFVKSGHLLSEIIQTA